MNPHSATRPIRLGFGDRLYAAMEEHGPVCVGIDPHASLLAQWGLDDDANGVREFSLASLRPWVGAPPPSSRRPHSSNAMARAVSRSSRKSLRPAARSARCVSSMLSVGDIGSTMAGYAQAYLSDDSPLAGDAVTLSPTWGSASLTPALELAKQTGRGVLSWR